jgi:uncharacterized membrane protein YdjX (TVP38/TMEM64 family)
LANKHGIALAGAVVALLFIGLYLYGLHTGKIRILLDAIRPLGIWGVLLGIVVLTVVNVLPLPGEFITLFLMEIYGAWQGTFYSWIAGVLGAIAALYLTRWLARPLAERLAGPVIQKVNAWIEKRETIGLLSLRLIPLIPYHLVNYAAGVLRVRAWPYIWTTALGILPFHLAVGGIYAGIRQGALVWGVAGGVLFVILLALGWAFKKKLTFYK